jgi:hypothetical protein
MYGSAGAVKVRRDEDRMGIFYACDTTTNTYRSLATGRVARLLVGRKLNTEVNVILKVLKSATLGTHE